MAMYTRHSSEMDRWTDGKGLQDWVAEDGKERRPYFVHNTATPGMLHFVVRSGDPPPDLKRRPQLDDLAVEVGAPLWGFWVLRRVLVTNLPSRRPPVLAAEDVAFSIWAEAGVRVTQKTKSEN